MRVLLDCRMATWSGIGRYTTGLARALAARGDLELVQVCRPGEDPPVGPGPNSTSVNAGAHPFSLRGALQLGRLVVAAKPDIIHSLHFPTPMPLDRPLVVTLHDLTPMVVPGVLPSTVKRTIYRRWNIRATRRAARIIVPSQATAQDVSRLFTVSQHKLEIIPEAVDDFSCGPIASLEGRLADLASQPYLLSMGNTKPHKDLPTLLQAFSLLASSEPDLRLLLVGAGPPGYIDRNTAKAPPEIRARVSFTGWVEDTELRALYSGALAFVFPSRYEGFGLPPLEAMAFGAPVVCAEASSLPEAVGEAALFFPSGDAPGLAEVLRRLLHDPALREDLKRAGREHAARFSWAHTAASTAQVYRSVLAAYSGRAGKKKAAQ